MRRCFLTVVLLFSIVSARAANGPVRLASAGSTFIYPILAKWSKEYRSLHPNIEISYDPVGSGHGIARALAGTVDFGASDGPLTDLQIQHAPRKIVHVPVVLGGVVPSYNLPGVTRDLRFTPAALAGIYLGTITKWNDPELARVNPNIQLPAHEITVIFRTDGSGTTYVWADYLSKVSPTWNKQVGRGTSIRFPVGVGAQFNEGVQQLIKETPYSIGYLQVTYAVEGHVQTGPVQNSTGEFVKGNSAGITAAAAATATNMPSDFRVSITNSSDSDAYPISSFSWILLPEHIEDRTKRDAIVGFLRWVLTDGQKMATPLHYAPLPGDVADRVLKAVDRIQ
jgi:phosphate transport system substrate-binding protein